MMRRRFLVVLLFYIVGCGIAANAQKLPNVQQGSLRAPIGVKIDGNIAEWNDRPIAYNHVTEIFYTIANDDQNLYLVVRAEAHYIIEKVLKGGITLTISTSGNKKDKNNAMVTFPMYDRDARNFYIILGNKPQPTTDTLRNKIQADSFKRAVNKILADNIKAIGVTGVKDIKDSVISVYNETGIKAAAKFNNNIYYTSEMAIPLKYLNLSTDKKLTFNYSIMLNGVAVRGTDLHIIETSLGDRIVFKGGDGQDYMVGGTSAANMAEAFPTNFWAEYTLARK